MMNQKRWIQVTLWFATALWVMLTLFLTLQNGRDTAATSNRIAKLLYRALANCGIELRYSEFHRALRTAAHFVVFCVFGLLFESAIRASIGKVGSWRGVFDGCVPSLVVCMIISVIPEVVKIWIPGRHLQWNEVLINIASAYAGVFGAYMIWRIGWR